MVFWDRWFKREEPNVEPTQYSVSDRELIKQWVQSINDSLMDVKEELQKIPSKTVSVFNESFEDRSNDVISKLDDLPEKIISPLKEVIRLSKQDILTELIRISAHYDTHDSNDSSSVYRDDRAKSIKEISKELTGKQKRLLSLLLDSGFLSYAEMGEKLGITHESAKNFVNRLLKDREQSRLFSKQETDEGIKIGVSNEVQDEILKKKYRTISNDSV
jgi:hypothetical protein